MSPGVRRSVLEATERASLTPDRRHGDGPCFPAKKNRGAKCEASGWHPLHKPKTAVCSFWGLLDAAAGGCRMLSGFCLCDGVSCSTKRPAAPGSKKQIATLPSCLQTRSRNVLENNGPSCALRPAIRNALRLIRRSASAGMYSIGRHQPAPLAGESVKSQVGSEWETSSGKRKS